MSVYWLVIYLAICPISGQEVRKMSQEYSKPSWSDGIYVELPNHLVAVAYPETITEVREIIEPSNSDIYINIREERFEWKRELTPTNPQETKE